MISSWENPHYLKVNASRSLLLQHSSHHVLSAGVRRRRAQSFCCSGPVDRATADRSPPAYRTRSLVPPVLVRVHRSRRDGRPPPACWPVVVAVPGFSSVVRILQSCGSIFNGRRRRVQKLWPRRRRSCPVSCPSHHQSPPPTDIGRFPQPQLSMAAFATSSTDPFSRHEGAGRRMIWQEDRRNVQVASSCLSGARRDVMRFS